jgi:hypothetical protein
VVYLWITPPNVTPIPYFSSENSYQDDRSIPLTSPDKTIRLIDEGRGKERQRVTDEQVVVDFRLTAAVAQQRIRVAAQDTRNVIWGDHVLERMDVRGMFRQDILRVLRSGDVDDDPTKARVDEWKCKITLKIRGARTAGVIVIILPDGKLFLKTAEWEDRK